MLINTYLQGLIKSPAERISRNSLSTKSLDDNGILYKLVDPKDYSTFRVLTDDQVKEEWKRNSQMARSMSVTSLSRTSHSLKFQPPKLGMLSKSAKIKKKEWEKQVKLATDNGKKPDNNTLKDLLNHKTDSNDLNTTKENISIKNDAVKSEEIPSDFNLISAVNLMKTKYIENIKVIEKLFNEKVEMEEKMHMMENQLRNSKSYPGADNIDSNYNERSNNENVNSNIKVSSLSKLSAEDIAEIMTENNLDFKPNKDNKFIDTPMRLNRSQSANGRLNSKNNSISPGRFQISPRLQADYDSYIHKRKALKQKEINDQIIEKQHELERAEKLKNVSADSPEFLNMIHRQKLIEEKKKLKLQEIEKQKQIDLENEKLNEKRKHFEKLERLSKPVIRHDIDWNEFAAMEEVKRKERINERKQQLALSLSSWNDYNYLNKPKEVVKPPDYYIPFKAKDDPEKITEKLLKQQEQWNKKLNKTKESIKESLLQRNNSLQSESIQSIVNSMERRRSFYTEKRKLFHENKIKKEIEEKEKLKENEKLKFQKLLNTKIHEKSKVLTKSAEIRSLHIKEKLEKERLEAEKKKLQDEQKSKSQREAGAVVKTIIEQREYERKQKVPSYIELRDIDNIASQKAAEKRKEMREKLRKQKQDLEEGKRKQPSLIERHEQKIAKESGYAKALEKIGNTLENKSSKAVEGIFDDKEKLYLGLE